MTWSNRHLAVYHGTTTASLGRVPRLYDQFPFHVDFAKCRADTDFGRGFYTTTSLHQAAQWANTSVRIATSRGSPTQALVLRFDVDRDDLAALDMLCFVRDTDDYFDLISFCRLRGRLNPNARASHERRGARDAYDVVFGPVALGLQRLVLQGCDQMSFHSEDANRCLCRSDAIVYDLASPGTGLLP